MSKETNPLLFIDSIKIINETKEEQKKLNKVYLNRIDDIKAMLYYKMNILCEIKTKNTLYEGVVINVNEDGLQLDVDKKIISIPIYEIENINILKL